MNRANWFGVINGTQFLQQWRVFLGCCKSQVLTQVARCFAMLADVHIRHYVTPSAIARTVAKQCDYIALFELSENDIHCLVSNMDLTRCSFDVAMEFSPIDRVHQCRPDLNQCHATGDIGADAQAAT